MRQDRLLIFFITDLLIYISTVTNGTATTTAGDDSVDSGVVKEKEANTDEELAGRVRGLGRTKKPSSRTYGPDWIN
jgi:hypothetical protein